MKKKRINKKKVPAYAFGIEDTLGIANLAGTGLEAATNETSGVNIAGQALGGAAKGAMTGLQVGGPVGAIVGGAVGLGSKLFSGFRKKKQIEEARRRKATLNNTKLAINQAAETEDEYWDNNELAYTFEDGGVMPNLAYVDNNEILRDYNGNITQVPNNKPGTDNHLINASQLDAVLSDHLKRPGTKNTFAKEGQILAKMTKPSKGKDKFAENTNRLNKYNANRAYNNLLMEQEEVKRSKGIKPKVKGVPAYEDGYTTLDRYGYVDADGNLFARELDGSFRPLKENERLRYIVPGPNAKRDEQGRAYARWGDVKRNLRATNYDYNDDDVVYLEDNGTVSNREGQILAKPYQTQQEMNDASLKKAYEKDPTLAKLPRRNEGSIPTVPEISPNMASEATANKISKPIDPVELLANRHEYWQNNIAAYDTVPNVDVTAPRLKKGRFLKYVGPYRPDASMVEENVAPYQEYMEPSQPFQWNPAYSLAMEDAAARDETVLNVNIPWMANLTSPTSGAWNVPNTYDKTASTNANAATAASTSTAPTQTTNIAASSTTAVGGKPVTKKPAVATLEPVIKREKQLPRIEAPSMKIDPRRPDLSPINMGLPGVTPEEKQDVLDPKSKYSPDWLSLAPTMYNMIQGLKNPEIEPLVTNPYANAARNAMARRRMNIEPTRLANARARAISNYNLANQNVNTGANLAARTQSAVDEYAANANMYAAKQNADNAYLADYANMMNNLGQQYENSVARYNDANARNRARARDFGANAASQLGKWSQIRRQEKNQWDRDQMMMPYLREFLSKGYNTNLVNSTIK